MKKRKHKSSDNTIPGQLANRLPREWEATVERLTEQGTIVGATTDIEILLREAAPTEPMAKAALLEDLWTLMWPHIRMSHLRGIGDWYKQKLAAQRPAPMPALYTGPVPTIDAP